MHKDTKGWLECAELEKMKEITPCGMGVLVFVPCHRREVSCDLSF